jgi:hypothetical protein
MNQVALDRALKTEVLPFTVALPSFNLARQMARVTDKHPDWSEDRIRQAEVDYRLFLAGAKASTSKSHIPSRDVDEVWHAHILFTRQYQEDCMDYFGFYFHHEPFDRPTARLEEAEHSDKCCGTGCANKCGGCCESGKCSGGNCKGKTTPH